MTTSSGSWWTPPSAGFVLWLAADNALQLAGHLVEILENRDLLRARYTERRLAESPSQP